MLNLPRLTQIPAGLTGVAAGAVNSKQHVITLFFFRHFMSRTPRPSTHSKVSLCCPAFRGERHAANPSERRTRSDRPLRHHHIARMRPSVMTGWGKLPSLPSSTRTPAPPLPRLKVILFHLLLRIVFITPRRRLPWRGEPGGALVVPPRSRRSARRSSRRPRRGRPTRRGGATHPGRPSSPTRPSVFRELSDRGAATQGNGGEGGT